MKKILFYIMNFILIPVLVITDQVTKQLALKNLNGKPPVDIIKMFCSLHTFVMMEQHGECFRANNGFL